MVIPAGLLAQRNAEQGIEPTKGSFFAEDPQARKIIEGLAMKAVMDAEMALGNKPLDVSALKVGYDIQSLDPKAGHLRFIEVKGRIDGADTVMITRQEVITSLHEPEKFILAIVQVDNGFAREPCYLRGALDTREPPFDQNAIQFNIKRLLDRAEAPA